MFDNSKPLSLVGVLFAIVGVVGYAVFGWRFGGDSSTAANVLALVAVVGALGATLLRRTRS
jgi:drug/metabolite transporter (DMT)-like permease